MCDVSSTGVYKGVYFYKILELSPLTPHLHKLEAEAGWQIEDTEPSRVQKDSQDLSHNRILQHPLD